MSTVPESVPTAGAVSKPTQIKSCLSCRLLSGGGLIAAGLYVFRAANPTVRAGGRAAAGSVIQLAFAASLGALGIVVIADPARTSPKSSTD